MPALESLLFRNRNSFSGFGLSKVINCNCYQGEAVLNSDGSCGCSDGSLPHTPNEPLVRLQVKRNPLDLLQILRGNQPQTLTVTPKTLTPTTQENLMNWIKDNPLIVAGGAAGVLGLGYLLLKGK